jgi:hypothetical protein
MEYVLLFCVAGGIGFMIWNSYQSRRAALLESPETGQGYSTPATDAASRSVTPVDSQAAPVNLPPFESWWRRAVRDVVHLMIVGETNSGKSTAATALLVCRAQIDRVLILDPHARPGDWAGLPAIGRGRDYPAIERALAQLEREMTERYLQAAEGKPYGPPLTIFIDEYPTIAANCPTAAKAFKALAREGRKVAMRLVVLTQDANVKTLGIEGEGPVRESFSRLLLGSFATKALPADAPRQEFPAAFDYRGEVLPVSTAAYPAYGKLAVNPVRLWGDLLEQAPAESLSLPLSAPAGSVPERKIADSGDSDSADSGQKLSDRRIKAVQRAARAGMSRTLIIDLLGISPNKGYVLLDEILGPEVREKALQQAGPAASPAAEPVAA